MNETNSAFSLEQTLDTLEHIVSHMENNVLSIESTLCEYEKGIQLIRKCQKVLADAEQKVRILCERNGHQELVDYNPSSTES